MGSLSVPQDRQMLLVPEVLALAPDLVILPFLPYDLASFAEEAKPVKTTGEPLARFPTEMASTFLTQLRHYLRESRALVIAQHFLLENDSHLLLRAYQLGGEEDALRVPSSVAFERRYARLEAALAELARSLSAHGVPLILLPVPNRIQAALLSGDATLPNVNPWAFSWEMEAIGARAGIQMANVFQKFASRPRAELLFYAIDGHPSGDAHALMADAVDELLRNRAVPAFADCFRT
jgi:hypothetical protein